ncbi:hypothetical protein OESDEN_13662 [Oesophagostomum dentatum]|uniref:Uncharacterized protein n=1 Tax=Oesophagostomum dentatum TaxID=61180 RepID=A0A0B1SRR6_OESDE|nr:hypothetical protein OESDEN_13662 [Oesophagostomum dentatum]
MWRMVESCELSLFLESVSMESSGKMWW